MVSNAFDERGGRLDVPLDEFKTHWTLPPSDRAFTIAFTGQTLPLTRRHEILGYVRGRSVGNGPVEMQVALMDVIQEEAVDDSTIGRGVDGSLPAATCC
jgi:hypothetical protein